MGTHSQELFDSARAQLQRGQIDQAIETLAQLLGEDPEHGDAHALLAICLVRRKRLHAARLEAGVAAQIDPESIFAHMAMAATLLASRDFQGSERHLQVAGELAGESSDIEQERARLYLVWHRLATAQVHIERACVLAADDASAFALRAQIAMARGQRGEAARWAAEALAIDAGNVDALVTLGHCALADGRADEARDHAVWALTNDPGDESAMVLLAAVKARRSLMLGAWWRLQTWLSAGSRTRTVLILIAMYLFYRVAVILLETSGKQHIARPLSYVWLGFCVYTWVAPAIFQKALRREMQQVRLRRDF